MDSWMVDEWQMNDGWLDRWMDGWMDGSWTVDGWQMGGWMVDNGRWMVNGSYMVGRQIVDEQQMDGIQ